MEVFDFGLGWSDISEEYVFIQSLRSECRLRGLRFILVDEKSLVDVNEQLKKDKIKIKFFLDLCSETINLEDKFTKFVYNLKDSGTRVVADPDRVRFSSDKSISHFNLVNANIAVPYTVVIRNWEPTRRLNDYERVNLGIPFVIKPALGYGQKGVKIINNVYSLKEIADARTFNPGDNFLIQEFIVPQDLAGTPAWFRVFYIFGETALCWWNPETGIYRQVSLREFDQFKLTPLVRITSEIASITEIEWFSSEIAINRKNTRFTVIDYMNDQFDISSQSQRAVGLPDDLLIHFAQKIVEKAWQHMMGQSPSTYRAVWFPRIKVKDEGI
jgi:hypothetical protein